MVGLCDGQEHMSERAHVFVLTVGLDDDIFSEDERRHSLLRSVAEGWPFSGLLMPLRRMRSGRVFVGLVGTATEDRDDGPRHHAE